MESPASIAPHLTLGLSGVKVRNTFLEFQDPGCEDLLAEFGFGRQCSEPVKSSLARQISELTTESSNSGRGRTSLEESSTDFEDSLPFLAAGLHTSPAPVPDVLAGLDPHVLLNSGLTGSTLQATYQALLASSPGIAPPPVAPMRFCPECGNEVDPTHRFCPYCCYRLQQPAATTAVAAAHAAASMAASVASAAAAAAMSTQQRMEFEQSQSWQPCKVKSSASSGSKGDFLSSLKRFRYKESSPLDVELAKALYLNFAISSKLEAVQKRAAS
mmetsp:Transcript_17584/g.30807  ORF Transcript_17584/g.30807 Transcript_17584/m.30807 type:complete len:272 (-) Transcript_17584:12-827(-)